MADLISRAAAIEAIVFNSENRFAVDVLNDVPAVDAAPVVHARWVRSEDGDGIVCTACGEDYCDMVVGCNPKEWKFCPVCGARMDGERRDDDGTVD